MTEDTIVSLPHPAQPDTVWAAVLLFLRMIENGGPVIIALALLQFGLLTAWAIYWAPGILKPLAYLLSSIRGAAPSEREEEMERKIIKLEQELELMRAQLKEQARLLKVMAKFVDHSKVDPDVLKTLLRLGSDEDD